jgi:hypothetical protein
MGYLTVHTEKGTPHAGIYLEFETPGWNPAWLGFFPVTFPLIATGEVKPFERTGEVKEWARWRLHDSILQSARIKTVKQYHGTTYVLTIRDCVSFARDFAENCGLRTAGMGYLMPEQLLSDLRILNGACTFCTPPRPGDVIDLGDV